MPIITSSFKPLYVFKSGFVSTVYSGLVRRVSIQQQRERIILDDNDFLDLDWSYANTPSYRLIVVLHGLEGHGQRPYVTGTAKLFNANGVDAVCVNFRGCSGEDNLFYHSYHSGATADLAQVINHVIARKNYTEIYIKGISLGANIILKYLGEGNPVPNAIKAAVAVSAPCDLFGASQEIHKFKNKPYHDRFLKHLLKRLRLKQQRFPEQLSVGDLNSIKTLRDFDEVYTAKAHGFKNADDYYAQSSSLQFLDAIKTPTLIINALNDSFLSPQCYPVKAAKTNANLFLEMPTHGGHVGFIGFKGHYYNERRALEFVTAYKN